MFEVETLKNRPTQEEKVFGNINNTILNSVSIDEIYKNTENKVYLENYKENYEKIFNNFELIKYLEFQYESGDRKYINISRDNTEGIIDISSEEQSNYEQGINLTNLYVEKETSSKTK